MINKKSRSVNPFIKGSFILFRFIRIIVTIPFPKIKKRIFFSQSLSFLSHTIVRTGFSYIIFCSQVFTKLFFKCKHFSFFVTKFNIWSEKWNVGIVMSFKNSFNTHVSSILNLFIDFIKIMFLDWFYHKWSNFFTMIFIMNDFHPFLFRQAVAWTVGVASVGSHCSDTESAIVCSNYNSILKP